MLCNIIIVIPLSRAPQIAKIKFKKTKTKTAGCIREKRQCLPDARGDQVNPLCGWESADGFIVLEEKCELAVPSDP